MSLVKQSPHPRNLSQPTPGSIDREPDRDPSGQSSQGRIALVWSREPDAPSRTSAMTSLTVAAAARVAGFAGGDVLHIFLAILSWILREFLDGCAAYAQAMCPPIDPTDRELEFAELEAAKPVAAAPLGRDAALAAGKPRLTIAVSNQQALAKPRRGQR